MFFFRTVIVFRFCFSISGWLCDINLSIDRFPCQINLFRYTTFVESELLLSARNTFSSRPSSLRSIWCFCCCSAFLLGSPQFAKRSPLGRFLFEVAAIASTKASFQLDEDGRRVFSSKKKKESGKIWEIAAVRTFGSEGREVKGGGGSTLYSFREKKTSSFFFFKCRGENGEMVEQGKKIASWTHWTRNFYIHST